MERALEVIDSGLERCHALADLREEQDPVVNISLRCSVFEPVSYTHLDVYKRQRLSL